jgi:SOS-response transcriptional repressor LexA
MIIVMKKYNKGRTPVSKKYKKKRLTDHQSASDRVRRLLAEVWQGNQSAMAKDIECSQPLLSKIIHGKQEPGRSLLERIARYPGINSSWVLSGQGQPRVEPEDVQSLPVAYEVLPGPPLDHLRRLQPERYAVPEAFYRPTRYWLRLRGDQPVVKLRNQGIVHGDLILLETDQNVIHSKAIINEMASGIFAGIAFRQEDQVVMRFCRAVAVDAGGARTPEISIDTFERPQQPKGVVNRTIVDSYPDGTTRTRTTALAWYPEEQSPTRQLRTPRPGWDPMWAPKVELNDIVAVGLILFRDLLDVSQNGDLLAH